MANDHALSTSTAEQRARDQDAHAAYIASDGLPTVPPSSLTFVAFTTDGYVNNGQELAFVRQAAAPITLPAVDGIHWLALFHDTFTLPAGWSAAGFGTHYRQQQSATQPAAQDGVLIFAKVTVSTVITVVENFAYRSPVDAERRTHNVKNWGALGNGVLGVEAASINATLIAGKVTGGSEIDVPAGIYLLEASIIMQDNTHLKGAGAEATILRTGIADMIMINSPAFVTPGAIISNFSISELTLDGNKGTFPFLGGGDPTQSGIVLFEATNFRVHDLVIRDVAGFGTYFQNAPSDFTIDRVRSSANRFGLNIGISATNWRITNCHVANNTSTGIIVQSEGGLHTQDWVIANNVITGNGGVGLDVTDNAFSGVALDVFIRRGVIDGNVIFNNTGNGIRLNETATAIGGFVGRMEHMMVSNNIVRSNGANGLLIQTANDGIIDAVSIEGNIFASNTALGLEIVGGLTRDTTVRNNVIVDNGNPAEFTDGGLNSLFSANKLATGIALDIFGSPVRLPLGLNTPIANASYREGSVRGYARFRGSDAATQEALFNIGSIVRNSTGNYTITIATDMSSGSSYVVTVTALHSAEAVGRVTAAAAGTFTVEITDGAGSVLDPTSVYVVWMGLQ